MIIASPIFVENFFHKFNFDNYLADLR